jgi:hypothetical protein
MALTQGSPLPDITTTTTKADVAPDYYTNYLSGLSQAGQTAMGKSPTDLVAGYDPMQTAGYAQVPGAATAYQPGLTAAENTAAEAAKGIDPNRVQALMNPYTSNVVDEMARLSQQNLQRNVLPTMKAGFVGTGGLGSQRYAGALGQSLADTQSNLTGAQYGALSKGYSESLKAALDEAQLKDTSAKTQGALAAQEQNLGLTGAGALTKAGAEQQAYQQSLLDAPLKTATSASALMKGYTVPNQTTEKFVGPKAGTYGTSDLSNILGVLSVLGSAAGGKGMTTVANAGGSLFDFLKGQFGTTNPDLFPGTTTGGDTSTTGNITYNADGSYTTSEGKTVFPTESGGTETPV